MRTKGCWHTWVSVLVPNRVVTLSAYSMVAANPLPTFWRKESGGGGFGHPPPNVAFAFTMYPARSVRRLKASQRKRVQLPLCAMLGGNNLGCLQVDEAVDMSGQQLDERMLLLSVLQEGDSQTEASCTA